MKDNTDILNSYCRIRKLIGILGLLLPVIIVIFYGEVLPSISHYYYTRSAVFFIAILAAFGFFLISYRGYEKVGTENKKLCVRLSDNLVTHIGGVAILIVVMLPTDCVAKLTICNGCQSQGFCLFGHKNEAIGAIHLISAAIFFIAMGYMSLCNFTRGNDKKYHTWYKMCGWTIFAALSLLIVEFAIREFIQSDFQITPYDVYIMETIMVVAFAVSWLLKGRTIEYVGDALNHLFKSKKQNK